MAVNNFPINILSIFKFCFPIFPHSCICLIFAMLQQDLFKNDAINLGQSYWNQTISYFKISQNQRQQQVISIIIQIFYKHSLSHHQKVFQIIFLFYLLIRNYFCYFHLLMYQFRYLGSMLELVLLEEVLLISIML